MAEPIPLTGCTAEPLGNYLKALGVFRIVGDQADSEARAWWSDGVLWIRTCWSEQEVLDFFLAGVGADKRPIYCPTPVFAPWGGRPGFYDDGNRDAKIRLEKLSRIGINGGRFSIAAELIRQTDCLLRDRDWIATKPDKEKLTLIQACRALWPETGVDWLDACLAIEDDARFGFLLGTGGNEGSADITNNFWELIEDVVGLPEPKGYSKDTLEGALFDRPRAAGTDRTAGQHFPSASGSPNVGQGFNGSSSTNPWDVVLMMEGCILFAGALTKRLSQHGKGKSAFPFMIDHVATESPGETVREESRQDPNVMKCRAEFWMPLWDHPCSLPELKALLAEGRLQRRNGAAAEHSVRAMEAISGLGISRGVSKFKRFGLFERRGKGYYIASSLGDFMVPRTPAKSLDFVEELDQLRTQAYRRLREGPGVPERVLAAKNQMERAVARLLTTEVHAGRLQGEEMLDVVVAVAGLEQEMSVLKDRARFMQPCRALHPKWLQRWSEPTLDDGSPEFRLARAVAAIGPWGQAKREALPAVQSLHTNLLPVSPAGWYWKWDDQTRSNVWSRAASLFDNLANVLQRRLIDASKGAGNGSPLWSRFGACFTDLLALWNGEINEYRLAELIHGLALVRVPPQTEDSVSGMVTPDLSPSGVWFDGEDRPHVNYETPGRFDSEEVRSSHALPRAYALLKLLFLAGRLPARPVEKRNVQTTGAEPYPPNNSGIVNLLRAGHCQEALVRAAQRLEAVGYPPFAPEAALRSNEFAASGADSRRLAGLLSIPIENPGLLAALAIKPRSIE